MSWRSLKWKIAPDDFQMALQLVEMLCVDEPSDWHPNVVLADNAQPPELWRKPAQALRANDQRYLDEVMREAKHVYSPLGYRIVVRGYGLYLRVGGHEGNAILPELD